MADAVRYLCGIATCSRGRLCYDKHWKELLGTALVRNVGYEPRRHAESTLWAVLATVEAYRVGEGPSAGFHLEELGASAASARRTPRPPALGSHVQLRLHLRALPQHSHGGMNTLRGLPSQMRRQRRPPLTSGKSRPPSARVLRATAEGKKNEKGKTH